MTIKDLLVHVDQRPASAARLELAAALAGRLGAHLTALHLIAEPFLRATSGMAAQHMPADVIREHLAHGEAEADSVLAAAREAAAGRGVAVELRRESGPLDRLPNLLARHARHADLTLVGQPDLETGGVDDALLVEAAFMDSGRPALVVPRAHGAELPPRRALIAWDGSREAARATSEAIPLLAWAEAVMVLVVDGHDGSFHPGQRPGAEITAHLRRHGLPAELVEAAGEGRSVREVLLDQAHRLGADLLVMGGYGHSRLREMILGGTTRAILDHTTLPTLLAH